LRAVLRPHRATKPIEILRTMAWLFLIIDYGFVCRVGEFGLRTTSDVAALGLGVFLTGLLHAQQFGRFHVGNAPEPS
jgi:hypothetical protein